MIPDSRRLEILTAREIEDLYGRPRFTDDDRRLYFELSAAEREALALGAGHTGTAMHLAPSSPSAGLELKDRDPQELPE